MFQYELHPHIDKIGTDIFVYDKGGVIKHSKSPARVKVKPDDVEWDQILFCCVTVFVRVKWFGISLRIIYLRAII